MGRHKQFVRDDVTDKALQVFWRKGYVDTSLRDLEDATGVFKPALYAEYGDKAGMFLACVQYYRRHYSGHLLLVREPLGWGNIEDFLQSTFPLDGQPGCFEAAAFTRDVPILKETLKSLLDAQVETISCAITQNLQAAGVKAENLEALTSTVFTFYCGLSVLANAQTRQTLKTRTMAFLAHIRA
jgi:AcrR family transcriptional regulator